MRWQASAGVAEIEQLLEKEALAAQKRLARDALARLRQQLRLASTRPEADLRQALAGRDAISLGCERERCKTEIARPEQEQATARTGGRTDAPEPGSHRRLRPGGPRQGSHGESAAARYRAALRPWARLRLAHALLGEALNRFRERAQAPMVTAASAYFSLDDGRALRAVGRGR